MIVIYNICVLNISNLSRRLIVNIQEAMKVIKESGISVEELINIEQSIMKEDAYGNKRWYLNGKLHREDGPAIEYSNGDKYWYLNGKLHRVDGPAIEYVNGDKYWYLNGELHREDGPAIEYTNGNKSWFLNGELQFIIYSDGTFKVG